MIIKTKFDIGQKIYPITKCVDEWICPGYFIVKDIKITSTNILYTTMYSNGIEEQYCFSSQAEADRECEKKNKGGKRLCKD